MTTPDTKRAKRRYLVIPFILAGLVFAAYSVFWNYGAGIMDTEISKFIDNEESSGRSIEYEGRKIKGYPFTLRTEIDNFIWTNPGNWTWSGDRLNIVTVPHNPQRLILAPRREQQLEIGDTRYNILADAINIGLQEGKYAAELRNFAATANGERLLVGDLQANSHLKDGVWTMNAAFQAIHYTDHQGRVIESPVGRVLLHQTADSPDIITVEGASIAFVSATTKEPTIIEASGTMGLDEYDRPKGQLNVIVHDQTALLELLAEFEALTPQQVESMRQVMAQMGGTGQVAIPLRARDGGLFLGPVRIGDLGPIR